MRSADEQQRDTGGRRGWWLVGVLALSGAAIGAYAGNRIDPDVSGLVPSLAAAGFGLGGLIGLLLLAPVGLWRAWRRWARRRAAESQHAESPENVALWHSDGPEREVASSEQPERGGIEAPAVMQSDPEPTLAAEAKAPAAQGQPASEAGEPLEPATTNPGLESERPAPPAGREPGWYPDPALDGERRYWDGESWSEHVWRGRARERTRKARNRR
ncbi:DUF2510 domain-containing protein [Solirubrobacter soli]|uniref:DUF2510 domain-containing protein n=1 Tax=Solirubrobacter soli TaxID=363832 RepID=UPI00040FA19D|nr:DUF2510 domain-containing protein [Solirubrobacter soli]